LKDHTVDTYSPKHLNLKYSVRNPPEDLIYLCSATKNLVKCISLCFQTVHLHYNGILKNVYLLLIASLAAK